MEDKLFVRAQVLLDLVAGGLSCAQEAQVVQQQQQQQQSGSGGHGGGEQTAGSKFNPVPRG